MERTCHQILVVYHDTPEGRRSRKCRRIQLQKSWRASVNEAYFVVMSEGERGRGEIIGENDNSYSTW